VQLFTQSRTLAAIAISSYQTDFLSAKAVGRRPKKIATEGRLMTKLTSHRLRAPWRSLCLLDDRVTHLATCYEGNLPPLGKYAAEMKPQSLFSKFVTEILTVLSRWPENALILLPRRSRPLVLPLRPGASRRSSMRMIPSTRGALANCT